jgi:hypothetical protein
MRARALLGLIVGCALSACGDDRGGPASASDASFDGDSGGSGQAGSGGEAGVPSASDGAVGDGDGDGADAHVDDLCAPVEAPPFIDAIPLRAHDAAEHAFFRIEVVDQNGGAPLPGALLTTTNHIALQADVNGIVAFYEPGLMSPDVYFFATYPGYELPADGFGFRGVRLAVTEGGSARIEMQSVASATPPAVTSDLQTRLAEGNVPSAAECFGLQIVDAQTKRGVPLVRALIEGQAHWTDSAGRIALCNPDQLDRALDVALSSHGYGAKNVSLTLAVGARASIELERMNIAERLYRVTGQGIYRDSALLGEDAPLERPLINGLVLGQDTVQTAIYRGEVFWVWGDTNRASYPLGNFHTSSATSQLPSEGGLPPSAGVDLEYFVDEVEGFSKQMAPPATVPGDGVTWLGSLIAVPDGSGDEQLFAAYAKVPELLMAGEIGVVRFDPEQELFVKALMLPTVDSLGPTGHPTRWADGFVYYQPPLRIPATAEAMVDPSTYETFTALEAGSDARLERASDGSLTYTWKTSTPYTTRAALESAGVSLSQALDGHLRDPDSGEAVEAHSATSRTYNEHRDRFVSTVQQIGGTTSFLGEIWYAEGDTPLGPWVYARKVVSHDRYTLYNPRQHPFFDQQGGRRIHFEGTYVTTFAGENIEPTPRYDYNQIMYRLDLDDPRLVLPVAVYDLSTDIVEGGLSANLGTKAEVAPGAAPLRALFSAPDRPLEGLLAVAWSGPACGERALVLVARSDAPPTEPLFYALPPYTAPGDLPSEAVALYEHTLASGKRAYAVEGASADGWTRADQPLAYVWRAPMQAKLPVADFLGEVVAVAGEDQCLIASSSRSKVVTLDAGATQSTAGITRYRWTVSTALGCTYADGESVELELPAGVHTVTLEATDVEDRTDTDTVIVAVE